MNILIPHKWLLEHLETEAPPTELQKHVSLSGPSVERLYDRLGDTVYDIEVTTNRVDSMSVRGIAREAAVILTNAQWPSKLKPLNLAEIQYEGKKLPLPRIINQSLLCDRILCVVLDNIQHGPSPDWLQDRLNQVDLNPKDVVIDITNAVSHELGHPCHAFDYDKIMSLGGEIHVVEADPGMPFVTLDGAEYATKSGEVVFVNGQGEIIDLPGIMGTLNTAVDSSTQRVLLWVESIPADKIRFASMTHGIRTPAAQLNERDLSHQLGREVLLQATAWYQELAGARVASMVYDEVAQPSARQPIVLPASEIERYLGLSLPATQVESILTQLECQVESAVDPATAEVTAWTVTPPHFRTDLEIPVDLIEEVARIYGYHNLPSRILSTQIPTEFPTHTNFAAEEVVAHTLAALGYQEQITYSLVSRKIGGEQAIALKNALTSDKEVLRTHIIPSHMEIMESQWNTTLLRGTFELANVYPSQSNELPDEHLILAITDRDIRGLRGTLEILWNRLFIESKNIKIHQKNQEKHAYTAYNFKSSGIITHNDQVLGTIGWLTDKLCGVELEWREILAVAKRWPQYQPLPKTSVLKEDWTIELIPNTPVGDVSQLIQAVDPRIQSVIFLTQYQNRATFRVEMLDRHQQMTQDEAKNIRDTFSQKLNTASLGKLI